MKKVTLEIETNNDKRVAIPGPAYLVAKTDGILAVHNIGPDGRRHDWRITHIPTGRALLSNFPLRTEASKVATQFFAALTDEQKTSFADDRISVVMGVLCDPELRSLARRLRPLS